MRAVLVRPRLVLVRLVLDRHNRRRHDRRRLVSALGRQPRVRLVGLRPRLTPQQMVVGRQRHDQPRLARGQLLLSVVHHHQHGDRCHQNVAPHQPVTHRLVREKVHFAHYS